jgi:hypothetical protein
MERMSKEELNKRKRQKNYYLLVEKTTLYDHRNLKKWGLQMFKSYVELPAAQLHTFFFQIALLLKTAIFFQKISCLFQKIPPEKTHTIFFFLFPFDSVAFRKFYLQKMKNCPKKFTKHFSPQKLTFKIYKIVLVFFLK